jgi:hypothetical protein
VNPHGLTTDTIVLDPDPSGGGVTDGPADAALTRLPEPEMESEEEPPVGETDAGDITPPADRVRKARRAERRRRVG